MLSCSEKQWVNIDASFLMDLLTLVVRPTAAGAKILVEMSEKLCCPGVRVITQVLLVRQTQCNLAEKQTLELTKFCHKFLSN